MLQKRKIYTSFTQHLVDIFAVKHARPHSGRSRRLAQKNGNMQRTAANNSSFRNLRPAHLTLCKTIFLRPFSFDHFLPTIIRRRQSSQRKHPLKRQTTFREEAEGFVGSAESGFRRRLRGCGTEEWGFRREGWEMRAGGTLGGKGVVVGGSIRFPSYVTLRMYPTRPTVQAVELQRLCGE